MKGFAFRLTGLILGIIGAAVSVTAIVFQRHWHEQRPPVQNCKLGDTSNNGETSHHGQGGSHPAHRGRHLAGNSNDLRRGQGAPHRLDLHQPGYVSRPRSTWRARCPCVCPVVGFPRGPPGTPPPRCSEARTARENGAAEVDMVINIGRLKTASMTLCGRDRRREAGDGQRCSRSSSKPACSPTRKKKKCDLVCGRAPISSRPAPAFPPRAPPLRILNCSPGTAAAAAGSRRRAAFHGGRHGKFIALGPTDWAPTPRSKTARR